MIQRELELKTNQPQNPKMINLALQGGDAHGAYTWGVLDRLFESDRIEISAISGTSAGAMNAVVLADGLMVGGITGARNALRMFRKAVDQAAVFSPMRRTPFDTLTGNWNLDYSAGYLFFDIFSKMNTEWEFLDHLHNLGCRAVTIGWESTLSGSGKVHPSMSAGCCMDAPQAESIPPI